MNLSDAKSLCEKLMAEHGLAHWKFKWIASTRTFGQCHYADRVISLSSVITTNNGIDAVRNVILHEIAHALAGYKTAHGPLWKMVAIRIGCDGKRCFSWDEVNIPTRTGGYKGECACPGYHYYRHEPGRPVFCYKCNKRINISKND